MKYKFKEYYLYSDNKNQKIHEIELEDFQFTEGTYKWETPKAEIIWGVVENASSHKKVLKNAAKHINVSVYYLPMDLAVIGMHNIEFVGDAHPEMISVEEMNVKLRPVVDNVVWLEFATETWNLESVYRLAYVEGEGSVTLNYITRMSPFSDTVLKFKSIEFVYNRTIGDIESNIETMIDSRMIKVCVGEEANVIWSTLVAEAMKNIVYNPDLVDESFNFNKWNERRKDLMEIMHMCNDICVKTDTETQQKIAEIR